MSDAGNILWILLMPFECLLHISDLHSITLTL